MRRFDRIKLYDPHESDKNYVILLQNLDLLLGDIEAKGASHKNEALIRILDSTKTELVRLIELTDTGVDLNEKYAWPARNIYELWLYTKFILNSDDNLESFRKQEYLDEMDIIAGAESLSEDPSYRATFEEVKKVIGKRLEEFSNVRGLPRTPKLMAKEIEASNRYEAFYKLYSKYVHPTPWLLLGNRKHINNESFREIIKMTAQQNALSILLLIDEAVSGA